MSKKYVYLFSEGNENMRELLGGKGANLAEMMNLGMPVPYGFTVTTEACNQYYADNETINEGIRKEIFEYLMNNKDEPSIVCRGERSQVQVYANEIMYIEISKRGTKVHTLNKGGMVEKSIFL